MVARGAIPDSIAAMLAVLLLAVALLPATACGQVFVDTDRPDVANSTKTVPPGYGQVEAGYRSAREHVAGGATRTRASAETSLRIGVTPALEFRLDGAPYVDERDGAREHGIGDFIAGAKWRLLDAKADDVTPSFALAPFAKVPTAERPIGSGRADFGVLGLFSFDLRSDVSADVNLGLAALGQRHGDPFLVQGLAAVTLAYKIVDRVATLGEAFFGSSPDRGERGFIGVGAGVIWVVHRRLALDAGLDTMLAGRGPDFGFRIGATLLLGR